MSLSCKLNQALILALLSTIMKPYYVYHYGTIYIQRKSWWLVATVGCTSAFYKWINNSSLHSIEMERFFLFCFRSCLKGEHDREFYDILEIDNPNVATIDNIKKQYKKLSLSVHPDKLAQRGIEVTAEHKQKFLKIKEAYDVLSDPKRRKRYDQLGLTGLKLLENPTEVDPMVILRNYQKNHKDRTFVVLLIALIFAAILILPILFSLKCDGTLDNDAKWVAIWTPMWLVNGVQLVASIIILFDSTQPPPTNPDEDEPEVEPPIPMIDRLYNFISTILFILIQIFILMRLDNYIEWSWFKVFIPWFLYEILQGLTNITLSFLTIIPKPDLDNIGLMLEEGQNGEEEIFMMKIDLESQYFEKILEQKESQKAILIHLLRIWLGIFLALRLDHINNWNWGLVLLPIWVYLFIQYIIVFLYSRWGANKLVDINIEAIESGEEKDPIKIVNFQQGGQLSASSSVLCLSQIIPLFMALLLISRLEIQDNITTFVIILPVFIGIGCCCCVVFCAICMLSVVDMDKMEAEMKQHRGEGDEDGAYSPPEGGARDDIEGGGDGDSGGSGDSSSPFQLEAGRAVHSGAGTASRTNSNMQNTTIAAPATTTPMAMEHIEVDID